MKWVKRDSSGKVVGVTGFRDIDTGHLEELPDDHPDIEALVRLPIDPAVSADYLLTSHTNRVLFKALFKFENRMRAVEGLVPVTELEYTDIAKASYFEEL